MLLWKECSGYRQDKICFQNLVLKNALKKLKSVCPPRKSAMVFKITIDVFSIYAIFFSLPLWYQKEHELKVDTKWTKITKFTVFWHTGGHY